MTGKKQWKSGMKKWRFQCVHNTQRLTPCFWMATFVRWTNMLSSSLVLGVYFTVQNLQKPSLYLTVKHQREISKFNVTSNVKEHCNNILKHCNNGFITISWMNKIKLKYSVLTYSISEADMSSQGRRGAGQTSFLQSTEDCQCTRRWHKPLFHWMLPQTWEQNTAKH